MIRTHHGELMQTLSSIDNMLDRLQNSRFIEMKAQTGESNETNSSDPSYVCPCTFLAVLYKDIADEFRRVSIKHFYNEGVEDRVDFEVFNGHVDANDLFEKNDKIKWMDDTHISVAPNQIVEKNYHDILQYRSKGCKTIFVNAFIILHHWARHDAMKGIHTDQLLWQTKHDFSPYDRFYQRPKLPDETKHLYENLKSEDFTLTKCLRRWFYELCRLSYYEISQKDFRYEGQEKDIKHKTKRCKEKRKGFDDLYFKKYFEERFGVAEKMESVLRESIEELNSLLTGAGNESDFPDPVYAAVGRKDETGIYQELIARARIIFKNSVLAAFPPSFFTKNKNIDKMVSELGVIDVEPFVKLLMDEFNTLCIPKKLMSIYSDLYGVVREWIVGLVVPDQRHHIRKKFMEFVGYSDETRYDRVDSLQLDTFIKEELVSVIYVWRDDTLNYAKNARQRRPQSSFSNKMNQARIFPLFADQVNCLLRNCEFFLENENLGGHCDSLYSIFRDSIKEALGDMRSNGIKDYDSTMRWSLERGEIQKHMTEALQKSMLKKVKSLTDLSIETLIGHHFHKESIEYDILKGKETGKIMLPGEYERGSIIFINDRYGLAVAAFESLWNTKIYDSNDFEYFFDVDHKRKAKKMRIYINTSIINYTTSRQVNYYIDGTTRDIDDVEFVIFRQ